MEQLKAHEAPTYSMSMHVWSAFMSNVSTSTCGLELPEQSARQSSSCVKMIMNVVALRVGRSVFVVLR